MTPPSDHLAALRPYGERVHIERNTTIHTLICGLQEESLLKFRL